MKLTKATRRLLGALADQADQPLAEVIRARGGNAANVREAGPWADQPLGEVARAAAEGGQGGGQGHQDREGCTPPGAEVWRGCVVNDLARHPQDADPLLLPPRETAYVLEDVLEKVVYGCRDELILSLGDCFLRFGVDIDWDTITTEFRPRPFRAKKGYRSIRSAKPWNKYIGRKCGWTWLAWNQQGYLDSVLLSFHGLEPNVLLQTAASSVDFFVISLVENTRPSRPARGGKQTTNGKR